MGKIVILHTNDIHSDFEAMPKIASVLAERRIKHAEVPVFTVDCGDHTDRMHLETEGSAGRANVAVMNATGYDVMTIGNNEGLTFTRQDLQRMFAERDGFDIVCSNLQEEESGRQPEWMKPYVIRQAGGLRIGFIGATAPYSSFYSLLGWKVEEPIEAVRQSVAELKGIADVIVLVSHLGLPKDKQIAEEISGIDLILGGHTHHLLEIPLVVGNTTVCGCGKFGQYVGEVEITVDPDTRKVVNIEGRCLATRHAPADLRVFELIREYRSEAVTVMGREVAVLEEPLNIDWQCESRLGNLLAAGLRKWTGAEIGLVNAGQILHSMLPGPVTKGQLHASCPSPVNPCRMVLTGEHILTALEESLINQIQTKPIHGFGFRGKQLGILCLDGLTAEIDRDAEPYRKIRRVLVNGNPLEIERDYSVGTIDMFSFGIGYTSLSLGRDIRYFLPEFIRDILEQELRDVKAVEASIKPSWIDV